MAEHAPRCRGAPRGTGFMSSHGTDLAVRGHERYQCSLTSTVAVGAEHQRLIKLDKSAPGGGGPVQAQVVDLSMGGVGLRSSLFLPLSCRLVLNVLPPGAEQELSLLLRVQRVIMIDRAPTYYVGTAFEGLTPEQTRAVAAALDVLKASGAALVPEKPRA